MQATAQPQIGPIPVDKLTVDSPNREAFCDFVIKRGGFVLCVSVLACGPAAKETVDGAAGSGSAPDASGQGENFADAAVPSCTPSTGTWHSLIPGPGQTGYDAALATAVGKYDRFHEAVVTKATGLAGSINVVSDPALRAKVDHLLATKWADDDLDPTDDLMQYEGVDPFQLVTYWGMSTGMYAGSEMAADAYRYGVLRDRGGDCTEVARARKMVSLALDAFHIVVAIPGVSGSIARSIVRSDLPGDGAAPTTPIFDANHNPLPATKNNGVFRDDNSAMYPKYHWMDSCSRDMLFGWTFGIAAIWEVIKDDPTFDAATKARLQADAKAVLAGLMIVRSGGKDLEIWDPEGRRTLNGNMHETSIDRNYVIKNGPASMMALGVIAGLVYVVDDAAAKAYWTQLTTTRGLPSATTQGMNVIALGGDSTNYSSYNMLFMTAWMAHRYAPEATVRSTLKSPLENDLYNPSIGLKPSQWKQSFFDFIEAASKGDAWASGNATASYDAAAVTRGVSTLKECAAAPFYAPTRTNCDANEVAAGSCLMDDNSTVMQVSTSSGEVVANQPVPMRLRPPSNFFWRSNPFLVNSVGDPTAVYPGSDLRVAYWMGRYVRVP